VPPLSLTGERTLPDVPEENYCTAAISRSTSGRGARPRLDVVDMACGRAYGSDVLATAGDANRRRRQPRGHEHAKAKYTRPGVAFERDLVQTWGKPVDAVVFLQTIEHVEDRARSSSTSSESCDRAASRSCRRRTC